MAIYVLRSVASEGARTLAEALNGRRIFKNEGNLFSGRRVAPRPITLRRGDAVVCWGTPFQTNATGVKVLNSTPLQTKYQDALKLRQAGVATIEVAQTRPVGRQAAPAADPVIAAHRKAKEIMDEFMDTNPTRTQPYMDGVTGIVRELGTLLETLRRPAPVAPPAPPQGDWLGRSNTHVGGNDLLRPPNTPDFFVKKENIVEEFRIHLFKGKSIRAGVKVKRDGFDRTAHQWVRSFDGGWRIKYDDFKSKKAMRELAAAAVTALGLDFGAVDIGKKADGTLIVLEVNRAPGLEGGTVESYARAIEGWVNE